MAWNFSFYLPGKVLSPVDSANYLGVILDRSPFWKPYLSHLEAKTTKKLAVLSALARR